MQVDGPSQWTVVANPASAGGKAVKVWETAEAALRHAGVDFRVRWTKKRGDATEFARVAIQEGSRHILAVGGDGTNHEVVNGILQQQVVPSSEILYGLWPLGTGNDWIKTYQLPTKTEALVNMIKGEQSQVQDIGWVEFQHKGKSQVRFFVNILGMAYDGHVVYEVEQSLARGRKMSRSIYLQATFRSLLRYRTPQTEVHINGKRFCNRHILINAGICRYSGGGMQFVPHADPQDGKLAITVAGDLNALGVVRATPKFYNGKIGKHPKVELYKSEHLEVEVLDDLPLHVEADGEFLGYGPVRVGLIQEALRFLIP